MNARRLICSFFVLGLLATAPATAAGPDAAGPAGAAARPADKAALLRQLWDAQVTLEGAPDDHPTALPKRLEVVRALEELRATEDGFDLRALGRIARAAIESYTGTEVFDPAAALTGNQPVHIGSQTADLDGDGAAEVLDLMFPAEETDPLPSLIVRSGTDGSELWSLPMEALDVIVQPLDAGATSDLAVLELYADEGFGEEDRCTPFGVCFGVQGATFHWELTIRDGATGEAAWSRRWDGAFAVADGYSFGAPFAYGQIAAAVNGLLWVLPAGDHDADGLQDLVIDEIDVLDAFTTSGFFSEDAGAFAFTASITTVTRASVTSAATGAPLLMRAAAGPGVSVLYPGVRAVGDPTVDLLWDAIADAGLVGGCAFSSAMGPDESCAQAGGAVRVLEMIDGATMLTAWVADLGGRGGWVIPAGGDFDADGAEDIAFIAFGEQLTTELLSGADGVLRWSTPDILLGPVDATRFVSVSIGFDDTALLFDFNRRAGISGELLSSTSHRVELPTDAFDLFILAQFSMIPDASGDGAADAYAQVVIFANSTTVDVVVEDGSSGAPIFARAVAGERYALPVPDATGDGIADLLDVAIDYHRASTDLRFAGIELPGGTAGWDRTISVFADGFVFLDLSTGTGGTPGSDYILSVTQRTDEGAIESVLDVIDGGTGASRWTVGGPLSAPPPVPTGGISGTVTGEGFPFTGACVIAAHPDGTEFAFTLAASDGTYLIAELADGSYAIRFADCFWGAHAEEWFDDAASLEEASLVSVTGGALTTGIDADLAAL